MDYSVSWWNRSWDNKTFTINLKGKNGNEFNKKHKDNKNIWPVNARIFKVQLPYIDYRGGGKAYLDGDENWKNADVEYFGNFDYANYIDHNEENNDRKYDYFDGPGYGYGLHLRGGFRTIKESANEVEFQIQLPPVKNKDPKSSATSSNGSLIGQRTYYNGGYIIAWVKNDEDYKIDPFLKDSNKTCKKNNKENSNEKCKCVEEWKKQIEEGMKNELAKLPNDNGNSILDFFIEHNDGKNKPSTHKKD